jgi:hypothetical protein
MKAASWLRLSWLPSALPPRLPRTLRSDSGRTSGPGLNETSRFTRKCENGSSVTSCSALP